MTTGTFDHLRVLVVDDVPTVRLILRGMLSRMGWTKILEAEDGQQALALIRQRHDQGPGHRIDLVICDWNMPNLSGADLLRALRSDSRMDTLNFVMVSSEAEVSRLSEVQRSAVSAYIVKPFDADRLLEVLKQVCAPSDQA
jgi:two-component system chemotaxis response regulator CheY